MSVSKIAMIPDRMGSQRLKHKNIRLLGGIPLITRAIRKCNQANIFDEIWVNSEHSDFVNAPMASESQNRIETSSSPSDFFLGYCPKIQ